jgi:imidazolonepropionase-like amidohydrolase
VDVIKLALEPAGHAPVPDLPTCQSVVTSAHENGLAVVCHALTEDMVVRALEAGVDEFAHTPTQRLGASVVERMLSSGVSVCSTLHTLTVGGPATDCLANARDLVAAGVPLVYATDLGNAGTKPGVSVEELEALANCGLGREGALVSATQQASSVAGLAGRVDVEVRAGARTVIVVLSADPLDDPTVWRQPIAVVAGGRLVGSPRR